MHSVLYSNRVRRIGRLIAALAYAAVWLLAHSAQERGARGAGCLRAGWRGGGPRPSHAGRACAARVGSAHDSGVLAASARAQRTQLRHLARPTAAGTAFARDPYGGGGECFSARALHRGVQSPLPSQSGATGQRLCALSRQGSGAHLFAAIRAHREPGQHGQLSEPDFADRTRALARNAGGLRRDCAPTLGRDLKPQLWTALSRSVRRARRSDSQPETGVGQGRGKDARWKSPKTDFPIALGNPAKCAGFPLSHRLGGGYRRLTKPDISLATKSGHFNLLTTITGWWG